MEGAYNKVLISRKDLPHPSYGYFMNSLVETVRYDPSLRPQSMGLLEATVALACVGSACYQFFYFSLFANLFC